MTTRRLYKQGNSVVVAIPPWILEELGWRAGLEVEVCRKYDKKMNTVGVCIDAIADTTNHDGPKGGGRGD